MMLTQTWKWHEHQHRHAQPQMSQTSHYIQYGCMAYTVLHFEEYTKALYRCCHRSCQEQISYSEALGPRGFRHLVSPSC